MRMGIGLLALLVVTGIVVYAWSLNTQSVSSANKAARQEIAPVTGRGPDGAPMEKSADFAAQPAGLAVTSIVAGGYFETYYGLKQGDVIVEAGELPLKGVDEASATAQLFDMAQRKRPLVVLRAGQRTTLEIKQ